MIVSTLLSRYRIDAELGQGGMGVVYRAHDALLHRTVAVKVLNAAGLGTAGKARLLAEARAAARLNHPNIVTVYDAGETEDTPFIVMELVEGSSLRHQLPKTLDESLAIARQVCAALEHAHSNGIIHRDLKPENIVLTRTQTAKLMDFGLARSAEAEGPQLTEEGAVVGTFAYIAPELLMSQPASVQSDLYALGVMLYELTTGRPPFTGDNLAALVTQHLQAEPTPPRDHNPAISPDLNALILKLLSKAPADRPASAGEVLRQLFATDFVADVTDGRTQSVTSAKHPLPPPNNLPTKLSTFIGREKELARLKRLLSPLSREERTGEGSGVMAGVGSRLVTLTGSGGIGKTRLSIQAGRELLPQFPDGAWLVELAPLTDPALVPQTVCAVLGVQQQPQSNAPLLAVLTDYLRDKTLLLVLDNCEHLIDTCAQLAEHLLTHCPDVRLLASSREALGIEGETSVRVPSLSLPDAPRPTSETLQQSEAVRLFVERATAALPGFALNDANAPAIAQVCRRLDGIALAIELAAARVKVLKVEQIAARLDDAFRLLTGGSRTALPRQQTLRATIDWSYSLLSDAERVLLRRLAVFAGGWTLEAAESVGVGDGVDKYEVLDLLTQLANKSLVVVEREQGEEARYFLLETTRQYVREKLQESGEGEALRRQHAEYYLGLADATRSSDVEHFIRAERMAAEYDNLRAALDWSKSVTGGAKLGLQLALRLVWFWNSQGYWSEGRSRLEEALTHADAERVDNPPAQARLLLNLGNLSAFQGDYADAQLRFTQSQRLFRELGDRIMIAVTTERLGWLAREQGSLTIARTQLEEASVLSQDLGNEFFTCEVTNTLAEIMIMQGDVDLAKTLLEENLELGRKIKHREAIGWALNHLGHVAQIQGEYGRAMQLHKESLPLFREIGSKWIGVVEALHCLGETALAQGDTILADAHFTEALVLSQELRERACMVWCLVGLAGVCLLNETPERAAKLWGAAEALRQSIGVREAPASRATHERLQALAREQLSETAFNVAWAEGQNMTLEQAVAFALESATDV